MKKTISIFATLAFIFLGVASSIAQTQAVKVQPLFGVSYEKMLKDRMSLDVGIIHKGYESSFISLQDNLDFEGQANVNFTGVMPQIRFYTSKKKDGMKGFYIAPYAALGMGSVKGLVTESGQDWTGDVSIEGVVMEFGGNIGWQFLIGNGLVLGAQAGYGIQRNTFESPTVDTGFDTREVMLDEDQRIRVPNLQFSIGYAF